MLDPGLGEADRDKLAQEARGLIEQGGSVEEERKWGLRSLAYEIQRRTEADYRWYRFKATPDVLERIDHNLKIADGLLRFRVFKVNPEAPVVVPPSSGSPPPSGTGTPAPPAAAAPAAS